MGRNQNERKWPRGRIEARSSAASAGFTLIELMVVMAVIAAIAAVAVPKLMSARINANESAAISNLRSLTAAQELFRGSYAVDSNGDGAGEYGFLGELAGTAGLREFSGGGPSVGVAVLEPAILSKTFGILTPDSAGEGVAVRSGYCYKVFLPGPTVAGAIAAIPEDGGSSGGATLGSEPSAKNCAILWCAYAWPFEADKSGSRVFFVNQNGDVLQFGNRTNVYSGLAAAPAFDAALAAASPADMGAELSTMAIPSNDGNSWTPLN